MNILPCCFANHSIFSRFRELDPKHIPHVMTGDESHTLTIPMEKIEKMPELKVIAQCLCVCVCW